MAPKEKFTEMAAAAKAAAEDFNDFADDKAISWADGEIKRLIAEVERVDYERVLAEATMQGMTEHRDGLHAEVERLTAQMKTLHENRHEPDKLLCLIERYAEAVRGRSARSAVEILATTIKTSLPLNNNSHGKARLLTRPNPDT